MKKVLLALTVAVILTLTAAPQAHASAMLSITVSGTTVSCDNSTAAGVTACGMAGFTTSLNASGVNAITFVNQTVNGVLFGNVFLSSNNPGNPTNAFVLDTKFDVRNNSGAGRTVTVNFGINNFTNPTGPAFLSASQTANWTTTTAGDQQSFQAWERNTNDLVVPGGTAVATTALCVSPGGTTVACSQQTGDTAVGVTSPFALTGQQIIAMANGTVGSYTGTSNLASIPQTQVPEPSSVILLGTGMLFVAGRQWRKRKN